METTALALALAHSMRCLVFMEITKPRALYIVASLLCKATAPGCWPPKFALVRCLIISYRQANFMNWLDLSWQLAKEQL